VISRDVHIELGPIDTADYRAGVEAHHLSLEWGGDSFMAEQWLSGSRYAIVVDGRQVGVTSWNDGGLSLLTLEPSAVRLDRQIMAVVLAASQAETAYVASWDAHHLATFGAYATHMASQAYQFRLIDADHLRDPVPGLELSVATAADLDYLQSTGWQDDYTAYVSRNAMSVVRLDGHEAGIAVHEPNALDDDVVDIGMFVDPVLRRRGVGSSILALTARQVLDEGRTPMAGCWWRNWASRVTLEAAGLTCAGTIFRLTLDPGVFVAAAAL
jgi:GNAT superfamily N-acetyltransferase